MCSGELLSKWPVRAYPRCDADKDCMLCRWCITGTPLSRGLEDLYGLFFFLHAKPYSEKHFWTNVLQKPYTDGCPAGAHHMPGSSPHLLSPQLCMLERVSTASWQQYPASV